MQAKTDDAAACCCCCCCCSAAPSSPPRGAATALRRSISNQCPRCPCQIGLGRQLYLSEPKRHPNGPEIPFGNGPERISSQDPMGLYLHHIRKNHLTQARHRRTWSRLVSCSVLVSSDVSPFIAWFIAMTMKCSHSKYISITG